MKKNNHKKWIAPLAISLCALIWISCSKDRNPVEYETHPDGWATVNSAQFHGNYGDCAQCHTMAFATSNKAASCRECHQMDQAPAVCTACHALPPVTDSGLPRGMSSGAAGAHAKHSRFGCGECHTNAPSDYAHAKDPLPANVSFARAELAMKYPFSNAAYSHTGVAGSGAGTCSNVYCHSNGRGSPPVRTANWVGGTIACGDCHLIPPAGPRHPQNNTCSECHWTVEPASDFSDVVAHPERIRFLPQYAVKHVNGLIEQ